MRRLITPLQWCIAQTGDPGRAIEAADTAALLSPLDPMMFATYRARTFALLRLGKVQEAAECAKLVGRHAGDHVHAHAVAALTLAAAGRVEEAHESRRRSASYGQITISSCSKRRFICWTPQGHLPRSR